MEGFGAPIFACPRCGSLIVGMSPCAYCGYLPGAWRAQVPSYPVVWSPTPPGPSMTVPAGFAFPTRPPRWVRRTRWGLLLTALGLLLSWTPFVAALGALFLSLGSTFLFLGARGAGRRHEVAVVLAFFLIAIGGVAIGFLLGAFLLQAYDAANGGRALSTLRDAAGLLIWATLPATFVITAGFGLQIALLLPRRRQAVLVAFCLALASSAALATWLSAPEIATLGVGRVRASTITDFILRLSLYRMVEAPAYVGLGILYLAAYADAVLTVGPTRTPAQRSEKG